MGRIGMAESALQKRPARRAAQNPLANVMNRRAPRDRRLTLRKISQHNSSHVFEFSRLLEMRQSAIDLPGFHAAIFQNQNRATGIQFPRRPDGRFH